MKGICELYKNECGLRESHIYPKFVVNHMRKTGSKYLRKFADPNKRHQDGLKMYLLSERAELDFSKREKWFAENIFTQYLKGKSEFKYDENLYYFVVSFLWRVIILNLKTEPELIDKWYYKQLLDAEKEWRDFLTQSIFPRNYQNIYMAFVPDRIEENNIGISGVDYYMTRMLDATIVDNEKEEMLFVYGKFNRFVFWGVLKEFGDEVGLNDVKIDPIKGTINAPSNIIYYPLDSFLYNRINGINNLARPSEEQQSKILEEIMKDPDAFWNSDAGKSLYNDSINLNKNE